MTREEEQALNEAARLLGTTPMEVPTHTRRLLERVAALRRAMEKSVSPS